MIHLYTKTLPTISNRIFETVCGLCIEKDNQVTNDIDKVTCQNCQKTSLFKNKQNTKLINKYPNLYKAIKNKQNLYIKIVTSEQAIDVQKIAFLNNVYWTEDDKTIYMDVAKYIYIDNESYTYELTEDNCCDSSINKTGAKQWSLEHDCFCDEINKEEKQMNKIKENKKDKVALSDCGKTYNKFLSEVEDDCSNVYVIITNEEIQNNYNGIPPSIDNNGYYEFHGNKNDLISLIANYNNLHCYGIKKYNTDKILLKFIKNYFINSFNNKKEIDVYFVEEYNKIIFKNNKRMNNKKYIN